ncbi:MAG: DUF1343 domain-containing protein [Prevotellaceae bacterium]|jgi:uncharacterized protein YbbC (DUF1343 family)|nr:DUF1343 domain-containing protein [Prevotellaceae bacterium]
MMKRKKLFFILIFTSIVAIACKQSNENRNVITGAEQTEKYLPLLKGKKVGIMGNQTSVVGTKHLVDVLLENNVDLKFAFVLEHGFRGTVERGEDINNEIDSKTGLPLYKLYKGNDKADSIVNSVDILIFDIQDVGARFYTYVVGMHRLMQLCANNNKPLIILDRPNPNGEQVDGPVRKDDAFKSDISFHKIAMVHGLTVGELAQMINGEGWLDNGVKCNITVIPLQNYTHSTPYELPVIPSPSLPNHLSVRLFPLLCLFEATDFSIGRGTDFPFQVAGYPNPIFGDFTFTPDSRPGMVNHVEQKGNLCYGIDLRELNPNNIKFSLKYILDFYKKSQQISGFNFFARPAFFNKLAGNAELQEQIKNGLSEEEIRASWKEELTEYKAMRKKYLLYEDFE